MLPKMFEYREVLQHPQSAFKETDLQQGKVEQTPLGLPKLVTGGFALTACVKTQIGGRQSTWAIRCFHKQASDLQDRYERISQFLQDRTEEFFVKFNYQPEGIKVGNNWHPIVRMDWVEGQPLHEFVEANLSNPSRLQNLAEQIKLMSKRLRELGMAHGDLQHGNILVRDGKLVLIDYDGMYVPGMPYQTSNETGLPAFQHPRRDRFFFNETIDYFSSIAIYISLLCLATPIGPELWRHHTGENLIFKEQDYRDPGNSTTFTEIQRHLENKPNRELKTLFDKFQRICFANLESIPSLAQFIDLPLELPSLSPLKSISPVSPHLGVVTFSAHDILQLIKQDGEKITVIGRVNHISEYKKAIYINFEEPNFSPKIKGYKPFAAVIFSKDLDRIIFSKGFDGLSSNTTSKIKKLKSSDLKQFEGKHLKITGLLELIEIDKSNILPQIIIENARQIVGVTEKEAEIIFKNTCQPSSLAVPSRENNSQVENNSQKSSEIATAGEYVNRGNENYRKGDYTSAITDYSEAIRINPNYADAYYWRGAAKSFLSDKQGAIADYSKAIRLNPNYADAYYWRGKTKFSLNDKKGAITDYSEAIRINPNYAEAYSARADAKYVEDKQGTISDYSEAIRLNSSYSYAYYWRGQAKLSLDDKQGAIADFDKAIQLNPDNALAYNNRGWSRQNLGDNKGAIVDFDKAIQLNPDDAYAYYWRGQAKSFLDDKQGAIADYSEVIRINPNYAANAYYSRGVAKSSLGDKQGAIVDFDKAIQLNPNYADAYYWRGQAKSFLGDKQGAIADYSEAICINPNNAEVYSARAKEANSVSPSLSKHNPQPYLCSSCTYHLDNTCPISQRPYVKSCNVYQNSPKQVATQLPEKPLEQFFGGPIEKNFSTKQWHHVVRLLSQITQLILQTASNAGRLPLHIKILSGAGVIGFIFIFYTFLLSTSGMKPVREVSSLKPLNTLLSEYYTVSSLKNAKKSTRPRIKPYIREKIIPVEIDEKGKWIASDFFYPELPENLRTTNPANVGTILLLEWGEELSTCKVTIIDKSLKIIVDEKTFRRAGSIPFREIVDYLRSLPKK
jgi:tetratricopeptide (TPR) repeat protein